MWGSGIRPRWATLLLLAGCWGAVGGGELSAQDGGVSNGGLKMTTGPDGVPVISNESPAQHARRVSPRRVAVPDSEIERIIHRHSSLQRLDPELVQAVIQAESGYNTRAKSRKGAMGLMQIMPATATELEVTDPYDPDQNVRAGTTYLARLLHRYGRLEVALAAYNAGPTAVARHEGVPPYEETREYIRRVVRLYRGEGAEAELDAPTRKPGRKTYAVRRPGKRLLLTTEAPKR